MKNTIKAKNGFIVRHSEISDGFCKVLDGNEFLFFAELRSMEDYVDECKNGNNECAVKFEVFTTAKGNQFIYWGDIETGEDFITKVVA